MGTGKGGIRLISIWTGNFLILLGGLLFSALQKRDEYKQHPNGEAAVQGGAMYLLYLVDAVIQLYFTERYAAGIASDLKLGALVLIVCAVGLFVGAMAVAYRNSPNRYSVRLRHVKYALQYLSFAFLGLAICYAVMGYFSGLVRQPEVTIANCVMAAIAFAFGTIGGVMFWTGVRYTLWAITSAGCDMKPNGKEMKALRKSPRR